jgi:CRISPR/Cas system CMR-associated protein Cmr3 (group 5 of RAMP superfamily)
MIRSPRNKKPPKKFSPTQPNLYSQENYLLRFQDNDELIVVKRSTIRSIIEDRAIVGTGSKRRFAIIEAKGRIYILSFYKVVK